MIAIFPQLAACAAAKDIEKLAVLVRTQFGFTSPKIDISELLNSIGVESEALDLDCSGNLLVRDEKGQFSVIALVPAGLMKDVRQFRLAHLLGHFLLHVQSGIAAGTYKDHGFRELVCPYARYVSGTSAAGIKVSSRQEAAAEDLADEFAAAVLLPKSLMEAAAAKGAKVAELADFFGCSPDLVACRLARLGLVKQDVGAGKKSTQANGNGVSGMARIREIASRLEGSAGTAPRK
jgi:hypothetical protein